jgi:hypothetical protein
MLTLQPIDDKERFLRLLPIPLASGHSREAWAVVLPAYGTLSSACAGWLERPDGTFSQTRPETACRASCLIGTRCNRV